MRRRTLYVCALILIAAIALYFPLAGSTAPRGQGSDAASKRRQLPNFDALGSSSKRPTTASDAAATGVTSINDQESARPQMEAGHIVQLESRLGVPTFLWATNSGKARTLSARAEQRQADAKSVALEHLSNYASRYALSGADLAEVQVASVHDTGRGAIVVKLKQSVNGIEVFRDEMNIIMNRKLQLVAISGYLTGSGSDTVSIDPAARSFRLTREQAVASALGNLTGDALSPTAVRSTTNSVGDGWREGRGRL